MSFKFNRRRFLQNTAAGGAAGLFPGASWILAFSEDERRATGVSVDELPPLEGKLTLYLGQGEGGLYEDLLEAIEERNPKFKLSIRRGPTAALANTIVAETKAGVSRADVFWAVDSGAIGLVNSTGKAQKLSDTIIAQIDPRFRYETWVPVSGRIRTLPFHTKRLTADDVPESVMALADSDLKLGWAPAYGAFQSFITAMRLLEGEDATKKWLRKVRKRAKSFAGELGVVMAVARGKVDLGFANHYYTLRLKAGDPNAAVDLVFSKNDAGCLLNASGVMALSEGELPQNFIRYLLTREVQSYLASQAYEIPMIAGGPMPKGLPPLNSIHPPKVDLAQLADLQPTLELMRDAGVL